MDFRRVTKQDLLSILKGMCDGVDAGDSFDGSIEYHYMGKDDNGDDVFDVAGAFRYGNKEHGQGFMRLFGKDEGAVPRIESYSFGKIVVDGKIYAQDLIIHAGGVHSPWRRREGHVLFASDILGVINSKTERLIVGTGERGMLQVDQSVRDICVECNIGLLVLPTAEAVRAFDDTPDDVGCFHLTC